MLGLEPHAVGGEEVLFLLFCGSGTLAQGGEGGGALTARAGGEMDVVALEDGVEALADYVGVFG